MDKLQTTGLIQFTNEPLTKISFKSLRLVDGLLSLNGTELKEADFSALTTVRGKFTVWNTGLSNLNAFSSLTQAGAVTIMTNQVLSNIQGISHLTTLTDPAYNRYSTSPILYMRLGGVFMSINAKLTSFAGLENISSIPVVYLYNNPLLTNLCPLKTQLKETSRLPAYNFTATAIFSGGAITKISQPAVTITGNGGVTSTAEAMAIVNACN